MSAQLLATLYLPGMLALRIFGARGPLVWGLAPALSSVSLCAAAGLAKLLGAPFGITWFLFFAAGSTLALHIAARAANRQKLLEFFAQVPPLRRRPAVAISAALVALTFAATPFFLKITGAVPQHSDSLYHLNAVYTMHQSGDAWPLTAFDKVQGLTPFDVYYPPTWHQWIVASSAPTQTLTATNAALNLLPLIWLLGMLSLCAVLLHTNAALAALPLIIYANPGTPTALTHVISRWPNALMMALMPGLIAAAVHTTRCRAILGTKKRFAVIITLSAALGGITLAHLSAPISFVFLLLPLGAYGMYRGLGNIKRGRAGKLVRLGLPTAMMAGGAALFLYANQIQAFLQHQHIKNLDYSLWFYKTLSILRMYQRNDGTIWENTMLNALVPLVLIGLFATKKRRPDWISYCYLFFALLCLASRVPIPFLTEMTGWWFSDALRMYSVLSILGLPIAARGAGAITNYLRTLVTKHRTNPNRRQPWLPPATAVTSAIISIGVITAATPLRTTLTNWLYYPPPKTHLQQLQVGEQQLHERLRYLIAPGELVLGEAANGSALLPTTAGVDVALKQQNYSTRDLHGGFLRYNFSRIHSDPQVCAILRHYNIRYFYADTQNRFAEYNLEKRSPSFYGVFTGIDFVPVEAAGGVKVWRIEYCDNHFQSHRVTPPLTVRK